MRFRIIVKSFDIAFLSTSYVRIGMLSLRKRSTTLLLKREFYLIKRTRWRANELRNYDITKVQPGFI
jgi:hypothetical protein